MKADLVITFECIDIANANLNQIAILLKLRLSARRSDSH